MLESIHALTGGVIAYKIGNPLISLPLAFLSHFIVDMLPHWNPSLHKEKKELGNISDKTKIIIFIDCAVGLFLGLWLTFKKLPNLNQTAVVLLGCFFGILPDLLEAPYYLLNKKTKNLKWLIDFQGKHQLNVPFIPGMIFQIIYLTFLISIIK